ncbi:MAG: hypothetical protein Tsb002_20640 [Wenzhouxiangellaceae bacterium]
MARVIAVTIIAVLALMIETARAQIVDHQYFLEVDVDNALPPPRGLQHIPATMKLPVLVRPIISLADQYPIEMPDGQVYTIIAVERDTLAGGYVAVRGYIQELGPAYDVSFTYKAGMIKGYLDTPQGRYRLDVFTTTSGTGVISQKVRQSWLLLPGSEGYELYTPATGDDLVPPSAFSSAATSRMPLLRDAQGNALLKVLMLYADSFAAVEAGLSNDPVLEMMQNLNQANQELAKSEINVRLIADVITRLKPNEDANFDTDFLTDAVEPLSNQWEQLADFEYTGLVAADSANEREANLVALFVGLEPNDAACGVALGGPGELGQFTITRHRLCRGRVVFAHEVGHNLTLAHSDGLSRQINAIEETYWDSVMSTPSPPQRASNRTFYTNPNVFSLDCWFNQNIPCGDATHNSAQKVNNARFAAAAVTYPYQLGPVPTLPPDDFEEDDVQEDARALINNVSQQHNFADDTVDWLSSGCGIKSLGSCTVTLSNLGSNIDICISQFGGLDGSHQGTQCGYTAQAGQGAFNYDSFGGGEFLKVFNNNGVAGDDTQYVIREICSCIVLGVE